jgi:hypothetical protein
MTYDIDKDISVKISGDGQNFFFSIYNDKTNKSVATPIKREKLKGLADFINQYFQTNDWNYVKPVIGVDKDGHPVVIDSWRITNGEIG